MNFMKDIVLTDKRAIVTGGGNGIGRCISEYLARAGHFVLIVDTDESACDELLKKYENIAYIHSDITNKDCIQAIVDLHVFMPVNFVINNACVGRAGILSNCSFESFEYVQRVGVTMPYFLVSELYKTGRLAQGASIINIASTRAMQSQADTEAYSAAKGGILALTHALSISLAGKARVNAISPGWIETSHYHSGSTQTSHTKEDIEQHPAKRIGDPKDIAEMVMFLCDNDRSGFITGENIVIDGGMSKLMIYHGDKGWNYTV